MIGGVHTMFYSSDAAATRQFIRDVLCFSHTDVGNGWLNFDLPAGDMGVHPGTPESAPGGHAISFYCDDLRTTVRELESRGAVFSGPVTDEGFGLVTFFELPGVGPVQLYQPHYSKA
jgi:catechol 2,3-dioxygenase-like lactoylglutathione lyase family enzyme